MTRLLWRIIDWIRRFLGFYFDTHDESYAFSICTDSFKLGKSFEFSAKGTPQLGIYVERMLMNVPCPGFVILSSVVIDGLQFLMGMTDAFVFASTALQVFPPVILKKTASVKIEGTYTGMVPRGFEAVGDFIFATSMFGHPLERKSPEWVWRRPYWTYWNYWSSALDDSEE